MHGGDRRQLQRGLRGGGEASAVHASVPIDGDIRYRVGLVVPLDLVGLVFRPTCRTTL